MAKIRIDTKKPFWVSLGNNRVDIKESGIYEVDDWVVNVLEAAKEEGHKYFTWRRCEEG